MSIITFFEATKSVQTFTDQPISRERIMNLLDDAVWAPNHKLREPWRMICIEGVVKQTLASYIHDRNPSLGNRITQAPLCMIVTAKVDKDEHVTSDDFGAVCCMIQNLELLLRANGLGMTWDLADYQQWTDMNSLAEVQQNERIAGILAIGYADQVEDVPARGAIRDKVDVW